MLRKAIAIFCAFFAVFAISGTTFAATTSSTEAEITSLQKTCAVVNVQLHGMQAAQVTCASRHLAPLQTAPSICNQATTMIIYEASKNEICSQGTGYLAYRVKDAQEVLLPNENVNAGWFLWYYHGRRGYCNLNQNSSVRFHSLLITQLDPGVNHPHPSCPPAL